MKPTLQQAIIYLTAATPEDMAEEIEQLRKLAEPGAGFKVNGAYYADGQHVLVMGLLKPVDEHAPAQAA